MVVTQVSAISIQQSAISFFSPETPRSETSISIGIGIGIGFGGSTSDCDPDSGSELSSFWLT
jgi:hypothetical protein